MRRRYVYHNRNTSFRVFLPPLLLLRLTQISSVQDGKPYILSVTAGPTFPDQRNQGYTLAIISVFASVEDMKYYDNECEAHVALKKVASSIHQGLMMVYFQSVTS